MLTKQERDEVQINSSVFRCESKLMSVLDEILIDFAIERARSEGRKTVTDEDYVSSIKDAFREVERRLNLS